HHQRRRVRVAAEHAYPEPAAGRHPGAAQDRGPRRPGARAGGDPADDVRRALLRSPHRGRARGGAVPGEDQGLHRGPGAPAARELSGRGAPPEPSIMHAAVLALVLVAAAAGAAAAQAPEVSQFAAPPDLAAPPPDAERSQSGLISRMITPGT